MRKEVFDVSDKTLYLLLIRLTDGEHPEMYVIPAYAWNDKSKTALVYHGYEGKKSNPEYGVNETALHAEPDSVQISAFEARYDEILKKATDEYEYVLPSKYYREGYNLYRRMEKFKKAHLRFLYDYTIPTTNNAAERYLRNYKRKQKQAMSFRSFASIEDLCDGKSVLIKIRNNDGANVFQEVAQRFDS